MHKQLKALSLLQDFEESVDHALLSLLCDDWQVHISMLK